MEVVDEPRRNALPENPASAFRWSKTDESGHWSPITVPETEGMWFETESELLWQQRVDDHVWENTGKPVCLFYEEWSDLCGNTRDNITAYVNFNQSKDTGLTATKMTRIDELPRHLIPDSEWPRFLQATVAEWDRHSGYFYDHHHFTNSIKGHTKTFTPSNCALQTCVL